MVRVAGISTILILLLGVGSVAPQKVGGQEGHEVTLELVWEREFDEEEVIAGVLGQNGIIVITEDSIYRVDTTKGEFESLRPTYQGSKKPRWRRSWVYPAANGKYISLRHTISVREPDALPGTPLTALVQIEVINDAGERLWDLPLAKVDPYWEYVFYGGGWTSNEGYVVVTTADTSGRGKLIFYDPTGESIEEVVYSTGELLFTAYSKGIFSDDGHYFAFYGNEGSKEETDSPSYLLLMDRSGKLLWKDTKKTWTEGYGFGGLHQKLTMSSKGSYVAVTTYHVVRMLMFDRAGNLLWSKRLSSKLAPALLDFGHDEQVFLVSDDGDLQAFASQTGKRLWESQIQVQGPTASLSAVAEGNNRFHVLASASGLVLVSTSGEMLEKTDLAGANIESETRGRIYPKLSSNQSLILVVFPNQVYLYRIRKD